MKKITSVNFRHTIHVFYAIYFSKLKSAFSSSSRDLSALCPIESVLAVPIISALISMDRTWCIAFPIQYKLKTTFNLAMKLLTIPWIFGILDGLPVLLWRPLANLPVQQRWEECGIPFYNETELVTALGVFEFFLPFFIILICNTTIIILLFRRARKFKTGQIIDDRKIAQFRSNMKSARSLAILIIAFLITWLPEEINNIYDHLCGYCIPTYWIYLGYYLLYLNSAINPILYPLMQSQIREGLKELFCNFCPGKNRVTVLKVSTVSTNTKSVPGGSA